MLRRRSILVSFVLLRFVEFDVQVEIADINGPCGNKTSIVSKARSTTLENTLFSLALLFLCFQSTLYLPWYIGQKSGQPTGVKQSRSIWDNIPAVRAVPIVIS